MHLITCIFRQYCSMKNDSKFTNLYGCIKSGRSCIRLSGYKITQMNYFHEKSS